VQLATNFLTLMTADLVVARIRTFYSLFFYLYFTFDLEMKEWTSLVGKFINKRPVALPVNLCSHCTTTNITALGAINMAPHENRHSLHVGSPFPTFVPCSFIRWGPLFLLLFNVQSLVL
jgi:hypothetical protein